MLTRRAYFFPFLDANVAPIIFQKILENAFAVVAIEKKLGQRIDRFNTIKPGKILIGCRDGRVMFDSERGDMSIHY